MMPDFFTLVIAMSTYTVIYADDDLMVVNKPSGLLTVPGRGPDKQDCLINRILSVRPEARIVHRLDMSTSGLVIIPLNHPCQVAIGHQFEKRLVKKQYLALVDGKLTPPQGQVNLPLICDWPNRPRQIVDHDNGKAATTDYEVLEYDEENDNSRVRLSPLTGRSHQLRVHMQALGHAIIGDQLYAQGAALAKSPRLCLQAQMIAFEHPSRDGEEVKIEIEAEF